MRTYQEYEATSDKLGFIVNAITEYKSRRMFREAATAYSYFTGHNEYIMKMRPMRVRLGEGGDPKNQRTITVEFAKIPSNIFQRIIKQETNYLLADGIQINGKPIDEVIGKKANRQTIALMQYAMWGGKSYALITDKIQDIYSALEMFTFNDEWSDEIKIAVKFWENRTTDGVIKFFQLFEQNSWSVYTYESGVQPYQDKVNVPYTQIVRSDGLGDEVIGTVAPKAFPIVQMVANEEERSWLTPNIKGKIDNIDEITSRNATMVNDTAKLFWSVSSVNSGDVKEIQSLLKTLNGLGIAMVDGDETATPNSIDPQVTPRLETIEDLESDIYKDMGALNLEQLTQGNLTATAIKTSSFMLDITADELYYFMTDFIEDVCYLLGIEVESIETSRRVISNILEETQAISLIRSDIDKETALKLYPQISNDEAEAIAAKSDEEMLTGVSSGAFGGD